KGQGTWLRFRRMRGGSTLDCAETGREDRARLPDDMGPDPGPACGTATRGGARPQAWPHFPAQGPRHSARGAISAASRAGAVVTLLRRARPKPGAEISKTSPGSTLIPSANDRVAVPKKCTCTSPGWRNSSY